MLVRRFVAALLIGGVAVPAAAQDAQSLIAKNLEARGGAAAMAALKNVSFHGRTIFQGLDIITAYDGRGGWRVNPLQGRKDAEKMSADEARSLADGALIEGPLLASRSDGSKVSYLGREDFDGTLAYKVKVAQKDGDEFTYWLDPDTYLEIKVDETRKIRGAETTSETELGDYEKVAGVYFPMSVESWTLGQPNQRTRTIIASGTANSGVDASYFAEPGGGATPTRATGARPDASN